MSVRMKAAASAGANFADDWMAHRDVSHRRTILVTPGSNPIFPLRSSLLSVILTRSAQRAAGDLRFSRFQDLGIDRYVCPVSPLRPLGLK
jgi:hypothetical protein